jgi:hypothetical protein
MRTPTGTGASSSTKECEWKQGVSGGGKKKPFLEEKKRSAWRLPLVVDKDLKTDREKIG